MRTAAFSERMKRPRTKYDPLSINASRKSVDFGFLLVQYCRTEHDRVHRFFRKSLCTNDRLCTKRNKCTADNNLSVPRFSNIRLTIPGDCLEQLCKNYLQNLTRRTSFQFKCIHSTI